MQKIGIIGAAGRMGRRLVANVVEAQDLQLVGAIEHNSNPFLGHDAGELAGIGTIGVEISSELAKVCEAADVLIDFSTGDVVNTATIATAASCGVVIGTTALTDVQLVGLKKLTENGGRILQAYNMSLGVNLLLDLSRQVAAKLGEDYNIEIVEMHHNRKQDAPSGTAVSLAHAVCQGRGLDFNKDVCYGRQGMVGARGSNEIGVHALRGGDVVGDHTVIFATEGERIEFTHKASNRDTFANGALRAARFLFQADSGLYSMQDLISI